MNIADVEWIGAAHADRLSAAGVSTDDDLLSRGASRAGRQRLATATGLGHQVILGWVHRIELLRLGGIGPDHARLLAAAGVDSAAELARRDPQSLAETLAELGHSRAAARGAPALADVSEWIARARAAPTSVDP